MPERRGWLGSVSGVSDAKTFKAAKKKLGIISRRAGFGRDGEWSWGLPTIRTVKPAEMAADLAPKVPALVIYADHSRPDDHDLLADHAPDDRLKGAPVL